MHTNKTIEYYSSISQKYFDEWKDNQLLLPLHELLISRLGNSPSILDIGCGPGVESKRLVDLGARVTGIDLSDESLEIARTHSPNATFHKMDVLAISFPGNSFDAVLDSAVLFHFNDEEQGKIIKSIYRVLNDHGLLLSIYKTGDLQGLQKKTVNGKDFHRYVNLKNIDSWIDLVLSNGFSTGEKLVFSDKPFHAVLFSK